jgi:hypothetical protein
MHNHFKTEKLLNFYPSSLATNDIFIIRKPFPSAASTGEGAAASKTTPEDKEELELLRHLKLALTSTLADLRKDLLFISTVAMMEEQVEDIVLKQTGIKGNTPASMIRYKAGSALNKIDRYLDIAYELQTPIAEEDHHGEL